jgi:dUTPase
MSENAGNSTNVFLKNLSTNLLNTYDKIMVLKLFIDSPDDELKKKYFHATDQHNSKLAQNHTYFDAGFDLFTPGNEVDVLNTYGDVIRFFGTGWTDANSVNKLDFKVICSAKIYTDSGKSYNTGYYMYPRSSLSKTNLRLANATGIIDAGYRGHLIGMFDVVNIDDELRHSSREYDYAGKKFDRYLQICAPGLVPIIVEIVNNVNELGEETTRGSGGFGSTGR